MRSIDVGLNRIFLIGSLAIIGLVLSGCSLLTESTGSPTPIVRPRKDAPVTGTIDGETLIITNNTSDSIFYVVFPTEILPVIEWAPCLAPEVCAAEQRIAAGEEKQIEFRTITTNDTESITVFWWHFLEKQPGASIPPMEMDEITLPVS